MAIRVAINGFGRIGRSVFRILSDHPDMEVVCINDIFANEALAYLLKYDTVMGTFNKQVTFDDQALYVDTTRVLMTSLRDPAQAAWQDLAIDVVVESTGKFTTRQELEKHLSAGAGRVLLTVPPNDTIDYMVVVGVNDQELQRAHRHQRPAPGGHPAHRLPAQPRGGCDRKAGPARHALMLFGVPFVSNDRTSHSSPGRA